MNVNPAEEEDDQAPFPPSLPPIAVLGLTAISVGIFLWVWAMMWGHYIKKLRPRSRISTLAYANIVPGALLYINLPSLLLATRQNDAGEVARLHVSIALWGIISAVCLAATWIAIVVTHRKILRPTQKLRKR